MTAAKQVYEWVKTGHWSLSEFKEWAEQAQPVAFEIRAFNTTQALVKRPDVAQEKADALERGFGSDADVTIVPLYTAPPPRQPWVGLTGDEVNEFASGCHLGNSVQGAIRKAEAKLKEKNT